MLAGRVASRNWRCAPYDQDVSDPAPAAPPARDPLSQPVVAPVVRLGRTRRGGIAPSIFALVERGVHLHPAAAHGLRGRVVLRFQEGYPPVRMSFGPRVFQVEDGDLRKPDLTVSGRLPDVVLLTTARLRLGMPDPSDGRGRAVLGRLATGRIRLRGDQRLARGLLELLRIDVARDARPPPLEAGEPEVVAESGWIDVLT